MATIGARRDLMAEADEFPFDEEPLETPSNIEDIAKLKQDIALRCKQADMAYEEAQLSEEESTTYLRLGMKCGREVRWRAFFSDEAIANLSAIDFENYVFLGGYDAICSYKKGTIEAAVERIAPQVNLTFVFRRLLSVKGSSNNSYCLSIDPPHANLPRIELSDASKEFAALVGTRGFRPTLKLLGCQVTTHDRALALLAKTADSIFFQIDLLTELGLGIRRERMRSAARRPLRKTDLGKEVQYPKTELDGAPASLYWYARGASGMPLLQFLAFYQVIEFYFHTYSQADVHRKLKAILKDPTFRGTVIPTLEGCFRSYH
jgi:hypothetical protein